LFGKAAGMAAAVGLAGVPVFRHVGERKFDLPDSLVFDHLGFINTDDPKVFGYKFVEHLGSATASKVYDVPPEIIASRVVENIDRGLVFRLTLTSGQTLTAHSSGIHPAMTLFKCKFGCTIRAWNSGGDVLLNSRDPKALDHWPVTWEGSDDPHVEDVFTAVFPTMMPRV
jgi:hypothetical protein